jgi:hypothetical protein
MCSDEGVLSAEEPSLPERPPVGADGLPYSYFFVAAGGASAYASLDSALEGASDRELDSGWAVAVVEQRTAQGERWARTTKGLWIDARQLGAARPTLFRGESIADGALDLAWVLAERAGVWPSPSAPGSHRPQGERARFEVVHILEEREPMVRVAPDEWMLLRDLARPTRAPAPVEVTATGEHWIDVDLTSQTLIAYEGTQPVYATLVSTGRGPQGGDTATPSGVHRIWVKILSSDMATASRDDLDNRYSLEEVPYVQFFDGAVGLHGTYWHKDFGHVRSHGCVNLSPLDARWLFDFTGPRVPRGWVASYPTPVDEGTVVRVR